MKDKTPAPSAEAVTLGHHCLLLFLAAALPPASSLCLPVQRSKQ